VVIVSKSVVEALGGDAGFMAFRGKCFS